ncbi:tail sheath [Sinorhizobium phage phiM9]|uniref:Putative tail sheath monomer n=1 Tax=Sinorhizobium phage phiM9 TaxID=1636182 RepID=A0A0F6TH61_9CAUD|nr:tail sheath [Sinorhizobium phage phiM9]AKE44721.1 putative tail sheath monomer [Sinorhizobium phage phiM9]
MTLGLSPGVYAREIDGTLVAASAFARAGGFAGNFSWGPVEEAVLTTGEDHLLETFWKPNDVNFKDWFIADEYLLESGALRLLRVIGAGARNAIVGGGGSGLTVDINAINGEVTSAAINAAGTGYSIGDIVEIETGTIAAEVRVLEVSGTGAVTQVQLLSNGTGYVTGTAVETNSRTSFLVKNDYDFEDGSTELPMLIAKFPGELGNNVGAGILRASEFYGSFYQDRFIVPPSADMAVFDSDVIIPGETSVEFTLPTVFIGEKDVVATLGGAEIAEGSTAGKWSVTRDGDGAISSSVLTLHTALESFAVPASVTDEYTLANTNELDLFSSVVYAGSTRLVPRFNGTGPVPKGFFDIDPQTKKLFVGSKFVRLNGDGVTKIFNITTADVVTATDFIVYAGSTKFGSAAAADIATMKVGITAISGGYRVTFPDEFVPIAGIENVLVKWDFDEDLQVHLGLPTTSAPLRVFANQTEVHAVVFDTTGKITGEKDAVIETYSFLSLDPDARNEDGTSNFYVRALNERSEFIRVPKELLYFGEWKFSLGADGDAPTTADYMNAFELFRNKEDYEVTYLVDPVVSPTLALSLLDIAEKRQDAVSFISAPREATVNNKGSELRDVLAHKNSLVSTSYGHYNPTWLYLYDRWNGKYRWVPSTGTDAGMYAKTHNEINMWNVPAGYNRGYYRRANKVSWLPKEEERDVLVPNRVNVVVREKGIGNLLLSQRTMLAKNSVFADMNVRFLFVHVKKLAIEALKFVINEINDEVTRAQVRNALNPMLALIQANRGLYDKKVKCDNENNTKEVIQQKILKVDMYLKPALLIDGVDLRLIATPTGITFEEVTAA